MQFDQRMKLDPLYMLRWRLDYTNKPTQYGGWNVGVHDDFKNMATLKSRDGLLYARIEGKNRITYKTEILAEISGQDYRRHEWIGAVAWIPSLKIARPTVIVGMKLITRDHAIMVLINGLIKVDNLDEKEKYQHFESDGK